MLRSVFRVIALAGFVAFSLPAAGQDRSQGQPLSAQIIGQVRYAEGGQPAFNILVSCDSFGHGFIGQEATDRNGRFHFSGLKPDQYEIIIRVPGYVEERETAELYTTPSQYLQFRLKPDGSRLPSRLAKPTVVDANVPPEAQKEFQKAEQLTAIDKKESIEEGLRHLEKALMLYPTFLQAELKIGTLYMDLAQWDKAEQALQKALAIEPKTANALFALGEVYLRQKKDEEAEKVLLEGLQLEDRSFQGHLALGLVYWARALNIKVEAQAKPVLEKSYEQAKRALELNPNLARAHLLKGNLLLRARRAQDALKEFDEYLRLEPKAQLAEQTRALVEKIKKAQAQLKP